MGLRRLKSEYYDTMAFITSEQFYIPGEPLQGETIGSTWIWLSGAACLLHVWVISSPMMLPTADVYELVSLSSFKGRESELLFEKWVFISPHYPDWTWIKDLLKTNIWSLWSQVRDFTGLPRIPLSGLRMSRWLSVITVTLGKMFQVSGQCDSWSASCFLCSSFCETSHKRQFVFLLRLSSCSASDLWPFL